MLARQSHMATVKTRKRGGVACAQQLKVLAEPTRLGVMELLMECPRTVGELGELLQTEQSLLSHHLKALRDAELVETHRQGKEILYRPAEGVVPVGRRAIDLGCCRLDFGK